MNDAELTELIHKEIDGIISEEEKAALHEFLKSNPSAKKNYLQLRRTIELLDKVGEVEPPPHLQNRIMNSIDANRYTTKSENNLLNKIFAWILSPGPKLAFAFAMGIVLGIFCYSLFQSALIREKSLNTQELTGTMGLNEPSAFSELRTIPVKLGEIQGFIVLKRFHNQVLFDVKLTSRQPIRLKLNFNENNLQFNSLIPISSTSMQIEKRENSLQISQTDNPEYQLLFIQMQTTRQRTPVELIISKGSQNLLMQSITIPPAN